MGSKTNTIPTNEDFLAAFDGGEEVLKLVVQQKGKPYVFEFKRDSLAFDLYQAEMQKDQGMAIKNLLMGTAINPDGGTLATIFRKDLTLPAVLINQYAEALGSNRESFVKK